METTLYSQTLVLTPEDNKRLLNLCGRQDEHIRMIENRLDVNIKQRGYSFSISGIQEAVEKTCQILLDLYREAQKQQTMLPKQIHLYLQTVKNCLNNHSATQENHMEVRTKRGGPIVARGENQVRYIQNVIHNDINFGIGPAGTGKTYLAVACAVNALETERVSRIILTRPIVEAGEKLDFYRAI